MPGRLGFAYNWALATVQANLGQRAAEATYDIAADDGTPALGWNLPALRRRVESAKVRWRRGGRSAARKRSTPAWTVWPRVAQLQRLQGREAGGPEGRFPRFKSRRRATPSVRFTTGVIRWRATARM